MFDETSSPNMNCNLQWQPDKNIILQLLNIMGSTEKGIVKEMISQEKKDREENRESMG